MEKIKRGQSAMEFLMTYGWAVLIMLIVIAILFMLGVFNPTTGAPNSCVLPQGFSCYGYAIKDGGQFSLDVGQATGGDIVITRIGCSAKETSPTLRDVNIRVRSGDHKNLTGLLPCENEDGSYPAEDEYYRGTLYIQYTDDRTGIRHNVQGDIAYHVESPRQGGGSTPTPTQTGTATPTPTATPPACSPDCANGEDCLDNGDCQSGYCNPSTHVCETTCGNQVCDAGETCASCPADCEGEQAECPGGQVCRSGICVIESGTCGDGTCDANEDCSCSDCENQRNGCGLGYICSQGSCTSVTQCSGGVPPLECTPPASEPQLITGQTVISTPGNYYLNGDFINKNCGGFNCAFITFTSGGSGSVLDCQGHTINGCYGSGCLAEDGYPFPMGIHLVGATCVTVKNCVLTGWYDAVRVSDGSHSSTFENNQAVSNRNCGFRLWDQPNDNVMLDSNTASNNKWGFCMYYGACANFQDNTACGNWGDYSDNNILCNMATQNDLGGNVCDPYPGTQCSGAIVCNQGC